MKKTSKNQLRDLSRVPQGVHFWVQASGLMDSGRIDDSLKSQIVFSLLNDCSLNYFDGVISEKSFRDVDPLPQRLFGAREFRCEAFGDT